MRLVTNSCNLNYHLNKYLFKRNLILKPCITFSARKIFHVRIILSHSTHRSLKRKRHSKQQMRSTELDLPQLYNTAQSWLPAGLTALISTHTSTFLTSVLILLSLLDPHNPPLLPTPMPMANPCSVTTSCLRTLIPDLVQSSHTQASSAVVWLPGFASTTVTL